MLQKRDKPRDSSRTLSPTPTLAMKSKSAETQTLVNERE